MHLDPVTRLGWGKGDRGPGVSASQGMPQESLETSGRKNYRSQEGEKGADVSDLGGQVLLEWGVGVKARQGGVGRRGEAGSG